MEAGPRLAASGAGGRRARGDGGVAMIEFALVLPFLAMLICGTIDLGRGAQLQNRLSNAAREGAAVVQFSPGNVDAGCKDGNNATDRAAQEEPGLSSSSGFDVTVAKISGGTATTYTGCGTPSGGVTFQQGDVVRVTAAIDFDVLTPLVSAMTGNPIRLARSVDVVVQG